MYFSKISPPDSCLGGSLKGLASRCRVAGEASAEAGLPPAMGVLGGYDSNPLAIGPINCPHTIETFLVLIRQNKASEIVIGNCFADSLLQFLINNKSLSKLTAHILITLCAIFQTFFNDTWSDRATLIDELRIGRHTAIADDLFRWYAETEVFEPSMAEDLLIGWIILNIGSVGET